MSLNTASDFAPLRKKRSAFWWVAGFFVLLALLFCYQLFGPDPPIVVSKQTTFITEPLDANGLPDYEQYVLKLSREGVTPENNAVVLLWQALFPGDVDPENVQAMASELGLDDIPDAEDALVDLYDEANEKKVLAWLLARSGSENAASTIDKNSAEIVTEEDAQNADAVQEVLDQTMERAWTSAQIPPLAEWAATNKAPLDLIVAASLRPRYYAPSPTLINTDRDLLISTLLPHIQGIRGACRSLAARALLRVGEGRHEEAWQDLLAIHRLSRLLTQGPTVIDQLVAIALSQIACDGTVELLQDARLTAEQARMVQRDLAAIANFADMARTFDQMERMSALDAFTRIGAGGREEFAAVFGGDDEVLSNLFNVVSVDGNLVLRDTNRWYDRLAAAARLPDWQKRHAALTQVEADIEQVVDETRTPAHLFAGIVSRQHRSRIVSATMLGLFLPAIGAASSAEDRGNTILELTRLSAALVVYRAEHGVYPEKLDELVPDVLEKLPTDIYNVKPFVYKRDSVGYLLFTMGENGLDDGGTNEQLRIVDGQYIDSLDEAEADKLEELIPAGADDFSIRVPRPAFQLPNLAAPVIQQP